jgi:hypothetical protein
MSAKVSIILSMTKGGTCLSLILPLSFLEMPDRGKLYVCAASSRSDQFNKEKKAILR